MAFPYFGAFPKQVSQWLKSAFFVLTYSLILLPAFAQTYEAENATLSGPLVFSGQGSTGSYVDFQNASGDYIEWTIPATVAADYQLDFIYQLGVTSDRPLEVSINGVTEVASQSFPPTGSWQVWDTVSYTASFIQGNNTVRLTAIGSSGPNFDYLVATEQTPAGCPPVVFNSTIFTYAGTQDNGTATILDNQATLLVENNGWKAIAMSYQLTANTVIEFDFNSTVEGEEHAFGFNQTLAITNTQRFKLYGTQNTAGHGVIQDYFNYAGTGSYQHYTIPVGQYYTGQMEYLFFICDNDAAPTVGNSYFSNIVIYEDVNQNGVQDDCGSGGGGSTVLGPPSIKHLINFSDGLTTNPSGWETDSGAAYGLKGNGLTYGWIDPVSGTPVDLTAFGRNRAPDPDADVWRETLLHFDHPGVGSPNGAWEIDLPNGEYRVSIQVGDASIETTVGTHHIVRAEGTTVIDVPNVVGSSGTFYGVKNITVTDGKLTLDAVTGVNTKIQTVTIESTDGLGSPVVLQSIPADGAIDINPQTTISANFLDLPNASSNGSTSLDNTTISSGSVQMYEITAGGDVFVQGTVNGTGGGDAINFTPLSPLKPSTSYRFVINGVTDLTGTALLPFSAVFTTDTTTVTGGGGGGNLDQVTFINGGVVASGGQYTTLTMGPDGKLYGLTITGEIHRWDIQADGSLTGKETLLAWKTAYGGNRTAVGLTFDPTATAGNLVAYVTHCSSGLSSAPAWDGKLSRLSGANLATEELLVTNLPRSIRDHLTNSMAFRPGEPSVIYFLQGSNSAGGRADGSWGNRPERLLTAALLRLDLNLLPAVLPLDAQTSMDQSVINAASSSSLTTSDGFYNPYATTSPLTLYATGIRNAYDFVWHSNGQAYIATNGTAGGSLSPASVIGTRRPDGTTYNGPVVPAIGPNQVQRDWLFRVDPANPLGYYGHPNPLRGEYVLNRGFTDEADYPSSLGADANYRGAAFDFEFNKSPNGIIEYQSNSNGGNLQGAMLVCRYSGGSDLIALVPDGPNGDIATHKIGIPGFTGFQDPLDLTEHLATGNIYVSDYGRSEIVLLKPGVGSPGELSVAPEKIVEDAAVNGNKTFAVTVSNVGGSALGNVQLSLSGQNAGQFSLGTQTISSLGGGSNQSVNVTFSPTSSGPKFATLTIAAPGATTQTVSLSGLGTSGEPSLQWIVDAHFGEGVIDVGDDDDATNILHSTDYALPILGDEIAAQSFTHVDPTNPVTIEVLSVFGPTASNPITAFGWYEAGNPTNFQELFTVGNSPASNGQTVNVLTNGSLSFNPNSPVFGIFNRWPFFNNRILYSEDALNTFNGNLPHHVRVYPIPGEANTYVIATEEHIAGFDFQDVVVIMRNVAPFVQSGAQIAVENRMLGLDDSQTGFPADDVLVFHRLNNFTTHKVHDQNVLRVSNPGIGTLLMSSLDISNDTRFRIDSIKSQTGAQLSTNGAVQVPAGEYVDIWIKFIESSGTKGLRLETLSITHNASTDPTVINLNGAYMTNPEGGNELDAQQIIDAFGFQTDMRSTLGVGGTILNTPTTKPGSAYPDSADIINGLHGDLVLSQMWQVADTSKEVTAFHMGAFHGCCTQQDRTFISNNNPIDYIHEGAYGQTLLPKLDGSTSLVAWSNSTVPNIPSPGAITINGYNTNPTNGQLGIRVYKARDSKGNIIPYSYIALQDNVGTGCGAGSANCDWNDNLSYMTNIKPVADPSAIGIPDQNVAATIAFQMELSDYFNIGYPGNAFTYETSLSNGAFLPSWLSFDPASGLLGGLPPSDADSALEIAVRVVDLNGITLQDTFKVSVSGTVKLLAASTSVLNFGTQTENTSSTPLTITFRNEGTNNITLPNASITGADATEFSHNFVGTEVLTPGDSLTIDVIFSPANGGSKQAVLTLESSTPGISPSTVTLLGEGVTSIGILASSTDVVPFRARILNKVSSPEIVTLRNDGNLPVTISSVVMIGADASDFSHNMTLPKTIAAGDSVDVQLTLIPSSLGNKVGGISFVHNGLAPSPLTLSLLGAAVNDPEGLPTHYRVNAAGGQLASLDSPNADWSGDDNGANASPYRNGGSTTFGASFDSVHFSVPSFVPTNLFVSERSDPSGAPEMEWDFPVGAAGEYEVHLYFMNSYWGTSLPGQRVFDVLIEGNTLLDDYDVIEDIGHKVCVMKPFLVNVTDGNLDIDFAHVTENPFISGIEVYGPIADPLPPGPQLVANSSGVSFPATGLNTTSPAETLTLFNPGTTTLNITSLSVTGSTDFAHQANLPIIIPASGSYDLNLTFSPTAIGASTGNLIIDHNGVTTSPVSIPLTGEGVQVGGELDLSATLVSFPLTETNTSAADLTLTLTNTGNADLTVSSFAMSGPDASHFSQDLVAPLTLQPGGSVTSTVGFLPMSAGSKSATLDITHDGLNNSPISVTLSGDAADTLPGGGQMTILHRVNTGGGFIAATDAPNPDWGSDDNGSGASAFRNGGSITGGTTASTFDPSVPVYVPSSIYATERWDPDSAPEMEWDFPAPIAGIHEVRIYLMNNYWGTSQQGTRVFDIEAEGVVMVDNIDPSADFGHQTAGMVSFQVIVVDGNLDLNFLHVIENPLVNGIEILGPSSGGSSGSVLAASPGSVNFGTTLTGNTLNQTLSLTNSGTASITVSNISVGGTNASEFAVGGTLPVVIPAGGSTTLPVSFTPGSIGNFSASLSITHDGLNTSPLPVTLEGTGGNSTGGGNVGFLVDDVIAGISSPTSLEFGPDGRLYVSQQNGTITVYEISRNGAGDYAVTSSETINLVKEGTLNHNDDGSENTTQTRQVTGLMVLGTADNPELYVTSSDWRIAVGTDSNLDTNSGVLSRLTWSGTDRNDPNGTWVKIDLVRGLPRSEENHATNGLDFNPATNTIYIAQGGHTNKGAPSNNLSGTPEYALSGAVLSVDLTAINQMPVYTDSRSGGQFVYDLPTLDDPTRTNITNSHPDFPYTSGHPSYNDAIDLGDPFGGNNGLNQARWIAGGPVQVHSGGYRNPYDVLVTQGGQLFTFDNGPNGGWGGKPLVYTSNGTPKASSTPDLGAGDYVSNEFNENDGNGYGDQLHHITGYGYYGGHANPTRANPQAAGYYVYEKINGNWTETSSYDFVTDFPALPVDASLARPIEAVHEDNQNDGSLTTINASTNGLTEYTASNFGGALQGNLLAASFNDNIYRFEVNAAGDQVMTEEALLTGFGDNPLDVTALGDNDPFPGTIWVALHGTGKIVCFEPNDFAPFNCTAAYDPNLDEDNDGYSNADEIDNGTNPCSQGSKPQDYDQDFISNLNDPDDDNDGWLDTYDPFAIDSLNGLGNSLPVEYGFSINNGENIDGSLFGIGFTGVMTNGDLATQTAGNDYADLYSEDSLKIGGANSKLAIAGISNGTAWGANNDQANAFQYGINVDDQSAPFTIHSEVESPFFLVDGQSITPVNDQSMGLFMGNGDQDNYISIVLYADGGSGSIRVTEEINGAVNHTDFTHPLINNILASTDVNLYLSVDPSSLQVQPKYSSDQGQTIVPLGSPISIPGTWLSGTDANGLAVGVISSSVNSGTPFTATWDFLTVSTVEPVLTKELEDKSVFVGASAEVIDLDEYFSDDLGDNNLTYSVEDNSGSLVATAINGSALTLNYPTTGPDEADIIIRATDSDAYFAEDTFHVSVLPALTVLYRVNTGGGFIAATDSPNKDWDSDDNGGGASSYRNSGSNTSGTSPIAFDTSLPAYLPASIFSSERWDPGTAPEMQWDFPAAISGTYEVRLFLMNNYGGTSQPGQRVFDVEAEGVVMADDVDLSDMFGNQIGGMISFQVNVTDGNLDLDFIHNIENPLINGIEILGPSNGPVSGILTVAPDQVHFFSTVVATTAGPETVTMSNSGGSSLTISSIQLQGADASEFSHTASLPITLAPGANTSFDVGFAPVSAGSKSAQLLITHDGSNPSLAGIPISGEAISAGGGGGTGTSGVALFRINTGGTQLPAADGSSPDWSVDMPSNPSPYLISGGESTYGSGATITMDASVPAAAPMSMFQTERYDQSSTSPMIYSFPVTAGTQVEVRLYFAELYFGNAGSRLFDVKIEGATPATLSAVDMAGTYGKNVGAMLSHTVTVTDGTLDIEFGPIANNPAVKGIEIVDMGTAGSALAASTTTVSFDDTFIGNLATETIQLNNTGGDTLTISTLVLTGADAGMFAADLSAPIVILPFSSEDLQLSFLPSATGFSSATLQLTHDGTNGSPFEVTMSGTGLQTGGIAMALPGTVTFPSTLIDSSATPFTLTLANTGNANLTITGLTISGPNASDFGHDLAGPQVLAPGNSIPVDISFVPGAFGTRSATFTVVHDGVNSAPVTIAVSGEGILPVTASSVTYRVNVGGSMIAATDSPSPDWSSDQNGAGASPYRNNAGNTWGSSLNSIDASVPGSTPTSIFTSERWDPGSAPEMEWDFPVTNGTYEVRLYFMNSYGGTSQPGQRIFDVALEGNILLDDYDIVADAGHKVGVMKSLLVTVNDGSLDIDFVHVVENPLLNGIEILTVPNTSISSFGGNDGQGAKREELFPGYELKQNYPNPFAEETVLEFETPQSGNVRLGIYNQIGQLVWESTAEYPAGRHAFTWNGSDMNGDQLSSGMYHCVMETDHGIVGSIKLLKQ